MDGVGPFDIYPEHAAIRPTVEVERPAKAVADGGEILTREEYERIVLTTLAASNEAAHLLAHDAALRAEVERLKKDNDFWHRENDSLIETGTKYRARADAAEAERDRLYARRREARMEWSEEKARADAAEAARDRLREALREIRGLVHEEACDGSEPECVGCIVERALAREEEK